MKKDWGKMTVGVMARRGVIQALGSETNDGYGTQAQPLDPGYTSVSHRVLLNYAFRRPLQRGVEVFLEAEGYRYKGPPSPKALAAQRSSIPGSGSEGQGWRKLQKWDSSSVPGTAR